MTNEKKLTILGKKTSIPDSPEESRLETVENPHVGTQYVIRFTCPEFTTICPITAQPDFANIIIDYILKLPLRKYVYKGKKHSHKYSDTLKVIVII